MTERLAGVRLAPYTTLGLGGPAGAFVTAESAEEIVELVAGADRAGEPVLVLGGGSNLVVSDEGFDGLVVSVASRGVEIDGDRITVQAGEGWDALVVRAVSEGRSGIECLSGIPGLVGATPIQNVGAYGQSVSQTIVRVRVYDRVTGTLSDLDARECEFAYRHSVVQGRSRTTRRAGGHLRAARGQDVRSGRVQGAGGPARRRPGERAPLAEVRAAVLELRRGKGMVLDADDPDTQERGFVLHQPVLSAGEAAELELRAPGFPRWDMPGGSVKVPAAWLIENAGFPKGYRRGPARISTKHTLAMTNPEMAATTTDLLDLAREVRDGVWEKFGVTLVNEPVMVGTRLETLTSAVIR